MRLLETELSEIRRMSRDTIGGKVTSLADCESRVGGAAEWLSVRTTEAQMRATLQ